MKPDPYGITLRVADVVDVPGGAREIVFVEPSTRRHTLSVSAFQAFDLALSLLPAHHQGFVREMLYRDRIDAFIEPQE